ncbi:hypothetical protein KI688_007564 [Linnemannia hyalina]|uniref:Uncharacterized protein n=1 Tax=Linnemannia hyalina TaxID=64524 RepID=A0A9P8BMX9_9FUNG|nr:hypothetical protein KI688_007564 [Linnemannia hyalina]
MKHAATGAQNTIRKMAIVKARESMSADLIQDEGLTVDEDEEQSDPARKHARSEDERIAGSASKIRLLQARFVNNPANKANIQNLCRFL